MGRGDKDFVDNIFGDYRFKVKSLPVVRAELGRVNNQIKIKTSSVDDGMYAGSKKDIYDRYNDKIERKMRLEDTIRCYEGDISLVDDVLDLLSVEYPVECIALKLKHIECRTIAQIEKRLKFSRGQCFNILKKGESEFAKLIKIVS
ncbi:hypothetical protein [Turicibacter sanguinis]|uniref:hypothetical protein n=1 Tax=Turicibacter sanguinis TaxID=154288 RepID=UPI0018AA70CE|nr:hypothetical protein [Turicibacter sanguinis]MDB8552169.1 hypothetical protein [Turicibacter sanguinis]